MLKIMHFIIFGLIMIPQLFSQVKNTSEKGIIKYEDKGFSNNKALSSNFGYHSIKKCVFYANPQGFKLTVDNLKHATNSDISIVTINRIVPSVYSHKINTPILASETETYLGKQTSTVGVLNTGNGWARDDSGLIIQNDVYLYTGARFGRGSVYTGSMKQITRIGFLSFNCSASSLNTIISQTMPGVPSIEGASIAYNDTSSPTTSSGSNGASSDWAAELYDAYYAANGQPGWHYTMVEYENDINSDFFKKITDIYLISKDIISRRVIPEEFLKRYHQLRLIQRQEYFIAINNANSIEYNIIALAEQYGIDYQYNLNYIYLPLSYGTSYYPRPRSPEIVNNTKMLYPSYLFDIPKSQNWYLGNLLSNQITGNKPTYNHEPLPTYCNPNNDDYIPAAFLNPLILEELRQDWSFLTLKNVGELESKRYYFYDEFLTKFFNECSENCEEQLMTENPNLARRTYIDPNAIMPIISKTLKGLQKSKAKDKTIALEKAQKLIKTEDYYSNLINNKLIEMNTEWLDNKRLKKCYPKFKAIKISINTDKKIKHIIKKKK